MFRCVPNLTRHNTSEEEKFNVEINEIKDKKNVFKFKHKLLLFIKY